MATSGLFSEIKSFLIQAGAGVLASAITAYLAVPEQQLNLGSLALGIVAIPLFLLLGAVGVGLYGLFVVINLIDVIATKIGIFDSFDGMS